MHPYDPTQEIANPVPDSEIERLADRLREADSKSEEWDVMELVAESLGDEGYEQSAVFAALSDAKAKAGINAYEPDLGIIMEAWADGFHG